LFSSAAAMLTAWVLPGVYIRDFFSAIGVALVIALLNLVIRPIFVFLTIPITIVSLGLFLFVINAIIVILASKILSGFYIDGFWWAFLYSIIFTLFSYIFGITSNIFEKQKRI
jgi:putative membrane protein